MATSIAPAGIPIAPMDIQIDDVGDCPRITIDASEAGGIGPVSFRLLPDTVAMLVDALIGVAPSSPGECRIVVKCAAGDLGRALLALPSVDRAQIAALGEVANPPPYATSKGVAQLHPDDPVIRPVSDPTPGE